MNTFPFETLIKGRTKKTNQEKWYPTLIDDYKSAIKIEQDNDFNKALLKNISYNLQYLEFLQKEMEELSLSAVMNAMLVKTYVITGVSILEGIFSYVVKKNGWWTTRDTEEITTVNSNDKNVDKQKIRVRTQILRVIPEKDIPVYEMKLKSLIQILKAHKEGLQINEKMYSNLDRARDIRNKIHLTNTENYTDTDYNNFAHETKTEMQEVLYEILTSETIATKPECFAFLKPSQQNPEKDV